MLRSQNKYIKQITISNYFFNTVHDEYLELLKGKTKTQINVSNPHFSYFPLTGKKRFSHTHTYTRTQTLLKTRKKKPFQTPFFLFDNGLDLTWLNIFGFSFVKLQNPNPTSITILSFYFPFLINVTLKKFSFCFILYIVCKLHIYTSKNRTQNYVVQNVTPEARFNSKNFMKFCKNHTNHQICLTKKEERKKTFFLTLSKMLFFRFHLFFFYHGRKVVIFSQFFFSSVINPFRSFWCMIFTVRIQ